MIQELFIYDPAVVDQIIALLRSECSQAVARAGSRLVDARALAIRGDIEPVSGEWSNDDRFWVRSQYSEHRYMVTRSNHPTCDCPDFSRTGTACKHIWALSIVCQARFRFGYVPPLEQETLESSQEDESIGDDVEDDVVARAIEEMENYARHHA